MPKTPAPETTQDEPTAPQPVAPNGLALDRWGLPLNGPSRAAALGHRTDPLIDPADWSETPAPSAAEPVSVTPEPAAPAAPQE